VFQVKLLELLQEVNAEGNAITYREFDVNNKLPDATRDAQRFLKGSDGSTYYTDDHYKTFTKITK
jgi:guanyl-specific ribonuclease Sa